MNENTTTKAVMMSGTARQPGKVMVVVVGIAVVMVGIMTVVVVVVVKCDSADSYCWVGYSGDSGERGAAKCGVV